MNETEANKNIKTCSPKNDTTFPIVLSRYETIEPIIRGIAAALFLANSHKYLANCCNPSLTLSGIVLGLSGLGVGVGVGDGVGVGVPFTVFAIPNPIVVKTIIIAVMIATIVTPSILKSSCILSLSGILESGLVIAFLHISLILSV